MAGADALWLMIGRVWVVSGAVWLVSAVAGTNCLRDPTTGVTSDPSLLLYR